ncbi:MAG TPA: hypothetical protein VFQ39_05315, partial [Longimicrobium sp.]|nr:hypothetical protein [Longimicrobium sp.]
MKRKWIRAAGLLVTWLAMTGTRAAAQERVDAFTNRRLLDPTFDSPVRSAVPAVVVSAFRGDGKVEAQAGFAAGDQTIILRASAPFSGEDDDDDSELADLDGLTSGTTLSLTFSGLIWGPGSITERQTRARVDWCRAQQRAQRIPDDGRIDCGSLTEPNLEALTEDFAGLDDAEIAQLVAEVGKSTVEDPVAWCAEQQDAGTIPDWLRCGTIDAAALQSLATPRPAVPEDEVRQLIREFKRVSRLGWDIPIQYGLQGKVTPRTFDYLDPISLAEASDDRVGFTLGGGVGVFVTPFTRVDFDANYERSYKAGASTSVCTPLSPPGASRCDDAVLGGPTETDGAVMEGGLRHFLSIGGLDVGLNPRLRWRSSDDSFLLRAPIYFLPEKDGTALVGGITPAWDFDSGRFGLVLFVGSAFNLDESIR